MWHVIAVVNFVNGDTGVKVLPRYESKVIDYYKKVLSVKEVESIDLYLHNNPYFNRYPTSSALKVHPIDYDLLEEQLLNSVQYTIKNNRLVKMN